MYIGAVPFNHFVDDDTFVLEANQIDVGTKTIESPSELIFNPFELNDDANHYPLSDIDPHANFFNVFDNHLGLNCNHYFEDSVSDILVKKFPNMSGDDLILPECEFESVFIEIDKDVFRKNKNLIIGVIHRPPGKDLKLFNTNMEDLLPNLKK